MMKWIAAYLRVSAALLALAGGAACSKTMEEAAFEGKPIRFICSPVEVSTRANDSYISTGSTPPDGKDFAVYSWDTENDAVFFTASGTGNPGTPNFMNPLPVTFHNNDDGGKNNIYDASGLGMKQFWPRESGYKYSFCAYYPSGGAGITAPVFSDNTVGVYAFTVQDDSDDMVDFCVSDVANDVVYGHTNSLSGTVPLRFHHMLTRVQVKFLKAQDVRDDIIIRVKSASLENVNKSGTLTATYAQPSPTGDGVTGTTEFAWVVDLSPGARTSYSLTLGGVAPPVAIEKSLTMVSDDILLLVPQTLRGSGENPQQLRFTWTVEEGGIESDPVTETVIALTSFYEAGSNNLADIHWDANSSVTYTVVMRAETIQFGEFSDGLTVSIAPWGEEVNGYYDIIG